MQVQKLWHNCTTIIKKRTSIVSTILHNTDYKTKQNKIAGIYTMHVVSTIIIHVCGDLHYEPVNAKVLVFQSSGHCMCMYLH